MPTIDMSLEKLKTYQGVNPKPADFDEFWDTALAEINAIDPNPELSPYSFPSVIADCFELRFTSTKGARIYAKFARPKKISGKIPALLHFHGLSGSSDSWKNLITFASQGYAIASMDVRGQGGLSLDVGGVPGSTYSTPFVRGIEGDPHNLLYRDIYLDTVMLFRVVSGMDEIDGKNRGVRRFQGRTFIACRACSRH